ncbi:MAG: hypothetical protein AB9891_17780 [Anaerolineaceae bacterium]
MEVIEAGEARRAAGRFSGAEAAAPDEATALAVGADYSADADQAVPVSPAAAPVPVPAAGGLAAAGKVLTFRVCSRLKSKRKSNVSKANFSSPCLFYSDDFIFRMRWDNTNHTNANTNPGMGNRHAQGRPAGVSGTGTVLGR